MDLNKLTKYVDGIKLSDAEREAQLAPAKADQAKGELGLKIANLRLELKGLELQVNAASTEYPLDVDALSDALDALELGERRLEQLEGISKALFG